MRTAKIVTGVGAAAAAQWGAARLLSVLTQRATALEIGQETPPLPRQRRPADERAVHRLRS
jgi:hypothetical protein